MRVKAPSERADPETVRRGLWTLCALSRKPLRTPVVSDQLGRLYNKEAVVLYLLQRSELPAEDPQHAVAHHLRGLKDVTQLNLEPNQSYRPPSPSRAEPESESVPFMCPLNRRPMNGVVRFVYLAPCGCVMSESGLRAVAAGPKGKNNTESSAVDTLPCPICGVDFVPTGLVQRAADRADEHVRLLNPSPAEQEVLRKHMDESRARIAARKRKSKKSNSDPRLEPKLKRPSVRAQHDLAKADHVDPPDV